MEVKIIDGLPKVKEKHEALFSRLIPSNKVTFINVESEMNSFVFHRDQADNVSSLLVAGRFRLHKIK